MSRSGLRLGSPQLKGKSQKNYSHHNHSDTTDLTDEQRIEQQVDYIRAMEQQLRVALSSSEASEQVSTIHAILENVSA